MAKASYVNSVNVRGYVFSHTLQERISNSERNKGAKYISGIVNVATDDDAVNVIPVNFFVMEKTKAGNDNTTFQNLKRIMEYENNTYEEVGVDAERVRIDGSIDVNDFYGRDGQLVSGKRVRGSFLHFLNSTEAISTERMPATSFEADVLLQAAIPRESNDGSEYLSLQGFAFNYRGDLLPVTFSISGKDGMNYFLGEDVSASNPYFGKVWGDIRSTVVVSESVQDDSKAAFGAPVVQETTRTFRTWEVVGANQNEGMQDYTITQEELERGVAERQQRLAALQQRQGGNGNATFPQTQAAPQVPAQAPVDNPSAAGYVF